MDYSIRHFIPGRVRVHVPAFCDPSPLAESVLSWLRKQDFITDARINYDCASMVVEFDPLKTELVQDQLAMMGRFSLDDLGSLLKSLDPSGASVAIGTARSAHVPSKPRWPLALPSLSLALAFSANPLAIVVNVPLMLYNAFPIFNRAWDVWDRESRLNVDFLDTLAITVSIAQGNMVTGGVITW